jgi:RNA polymerase sigma-70 factor (ECF subfamily)
MTLVAPDKRLEPRGMRDHAIRYPLMAEEDLMGLVGAGDARAFAAIYDRHGRMAYSLAYRMMGEKQEAEDVVQEAFVKVWRSAGGYRAGRASVRTWILSIVRNNGLDHIRSRASRQRTREKAEAFAPTSVQNDTFAKTWLNFKRDLLREALEGLPHEQREVLTLGHLCGLTHAEMAERLRLPLGTVKGRLRLGLKKLRDHPGLRGMAVE